MFATAYWLTSLVAQTPNPLFCPLTLHFLFLNCIVVLRRIHRSLPHWRVSEGGSAPDTEELSIHPPVRDLINELRGWTPPVPSDDGDEATMDGDSRNGANTTSDGCILL